jgi:hypothetical protein
MRKLGTVTLIAALLAPALARDAMAAQRLIDVAQVPSGKLEYRYDHYLFLIYIHLNFLQLFLLSS